MKILFLFAALLTALSHATAQVNQITQISVSQGDLVSTGPSSTSTQYTLDNGFGLNWTDNLSYHAVYSDGGVDGLAQTTSTGGTSASTLDITLKSHAETANAYGSGHGRQNAQSDFQFRLTQPCFYTCTANFTADSDDNCHAFGALSWGGESSSVLYLGEGYFAANDVHGHSGTYSGMLQPGYYDINIEAYCGLDRGYLGLNGSATADISIQITGIPTTPPPVTLTLSHDGSGDATLGVDSRLGLYYQVQGSDDLSHWNNIGSPQAGTGNRMNFPVTFAPTGPNAHFNYRLLIGFSGSFSGSQTNTPVSSPRSPPSVTSTAPNHALQRTAAGR